MPEQPAARLGDMISCPMQTPTPGGPVPHVGGPIMPPCCPQVFISNQPAARIGDQCQCVGPGPPIPNPIMRGAFPVPIGQQPAARMTDSCTHPGSQIAAGAPDVMIGSAGTSGNPWAGRDQCQSAAAGRNPAPGTTYPPGHPNAGQQIPPNTPGQSYNNCGVESARNVVNQANGSSIGQEAMLNQAMANGNAIQVPGNLYASGGTYPADIASIMGSNSVPASLATSTMQNLEVAVAQGRGVVSFVDAGSLWGPAGGVAPAGGNHWVQVTGVEYDDDGNIVAVIINDTGMGTCGQRVPIATWNAATGATGGVNEHIVTNNPIW